MSDLKNYAFWDVTLVWYQFTRTYKILAYFVPDYIILLPRKQDLSVTAMRISDLT